MVSHLYRTAFAVLVACVCIVSHCYGILPLRYGICRACCPYGVVVDALILEVPIILIGLWVTSLNLWLIFRVTCPDLLAVVTLITCVFLCFDGF